MGSIALVVAALAMGRTSRIRESFCGRSRGLMVIFSMFGRAVIDTHLK
jgi:hypothetical protein